MFVYWSTVIFLKLKFLCKKGFFVFALCFRFVFSLCVFVLCFRFVFSLCVFALCFRFVFSFCVFALCFRFVFSFCVFAFGFRFKNTPHFGPMNFQKVVCVLVRLRKRKVFKTLCEGAL